MTAHAYDAQTEDLDSLELPSDVKDLAKKFFVELKEITKELSADAQKDKQTLEQMRRDAKTEFETKGLDKEIVTVTKAISTIRKKKLEWHNRLSMQVSQLCDRRTEEIRNKANADKRRAAEEKRQKTRAQARKPKENTDRRLMTVATEEIPLRQSAPIATSSILSTT